MNELLAKPYSSLVTRHLSLVVARQLNRKSKTENRKSQPHPAGFTILELLVAAFIALIVFGIGFATINGTIKASGDATALVQETESARMFFQTLERDLSGAWAGPFDMSKGVDLNSVRVSSTGSANCPSNAPYIILQFNGGFTFRSYGRGQSLTLQYDGTIVTDALQFYTRADMRAHRDQIGTISLPDRRVLVRYYLNPIQQTLCRQVVEDDGASAMALEASASDWPPSLSNPDTADVNALCENVRSIRFLLRCQNDAITRQRQALCRWDGGQWLPDTFSALQSQPFTDPVTHIPGYHVYTHVLVRLEIRDNNAMHRPFDTNAVVPSRTFVKALLIPVTIQ